MAIRQVVAGVLAGGLASGLAAALLGASPAGAQGRPPHVAECAACHGEDGIAREADVPHLAGQNELYLYNQLMAFRSGRRPHKQMRYMSREISESDALALAAYYAALPPR
jgi:cytochrome c553